MPPTIAIAGITSRLARLITDELLQNSPTISLRGSCRDLSKLPEELHNNPRVELIETNPYDKSNLRSLVKGCNTVICCYLADNETMIAAQKALIDICEEKGVARYIASDYTGDYTKLNYGDIEIKDPMKRIHAYLQETKRVAGVHVCNGLFIDSYWELFGFWNREEMSLSYWGSGGEQWEFTSYRTVAQFVAAVALDPEAKGVLKFLAERRSTIELADDFEAVYGTRPALKCLGTLEEVGAKRYFDNGQQNPFATGTYHNLSGHWPVGDDPQNHRYPHIKPETTRDYLRKNNLLEMDQSKVFQEYFAANKVVSTGVSSSGVGSAEQRS